jgi:hypothetical protein
MSVELRLTGACECDQFTNLTTRDIGDLGSAKISGYKKLQIAMIHHFGKVLRGNLLKVPRID